MANASTLTAPPKGPLSAAANPFNSTTGPSLGAASTTGPTNSSQHTPHTALVAIGGEVLFVIIASVIAGTGPKAATAMIAFFVVLWILFLINHYGS